MEILVRSRKRKETHRREVSSLKPIVGVNRESEVVFRVVDYWLEFRWRNYPGIDEKNRG